MFGINQLAIWLPFLLCHCMCCITLSEIFSCDICTFVYTVTPSKNMDLNIGIYSSIQMEFFIIAPHSRRSKAICLLGHVGKYVEPPSPYRYRNRVRYDTVGQAFSAETVLQFIRRWCKYIEFNEYIQAE